MRQETLIFERERLAERTLFRFFKSEYNFG